jgi:hypothetical protein
MIAETFRRSSDGKHIIAANIFQDTLASQLAAASSSRSSDQNTDGNGDTGSGVDPERDGF